MGFVETPGGGLVPTSGSTGNTGASTDRSRSAVPGGVPTGIALRPDIPDEGICWLRFWLDQRGKVVHVELLYCTGESGNNAGGDGEGTEEPTPVNIEFELECTAENAIRGDQAGCRVNVTNNPDSVDVAKLKFAWTSSTGTPRTATGRTSWYGPAIESTKVSVTISDPNEEIPDWSDSDNITVIPRSFSAPDTLAAVAVPGYLPVFTHGRYLPFAAGPSTLYGAGPWSGRATMGSPPTFRGEMWISTDLTSGGPTYAGAHNACRGSSGLPSRSDYWAVNVACRTRSALQAWRTKVIAHEKSHQHGHNLCIRSTRYANLLSRMESVVGDPAGVTKGLRDLWIPFRDRFAVAGDRGDAAGRSAPLHYATDRLSDTSNTWVLRPFEETGHGATRGCP